ncbi:MAG: hypothetical protein ACK8QZ_03790, partial [Anaerolineales bacterium]
RVGHWAPRPERVVGILREWLEHPEIREAYAGRCREKARPQAALTIAQIIAAYLKLPVEDSLPNANLG